MQNVLKELLYNKKYGVIMLCGNDKIIIFNVFTIVLLEGIIWDFNDGWRRNHSYMIIWSYSNSTMGTEHPVQSYTMPITITYFPIWT